MPSNTVTKLQHSRWTDRCTRKMNCTINEKGLVLFRLGVWRVFVWWSWSLSCLSGFHDWGWWTEACWGQQKLNSNTPRFGQMCFSGAEWRPRAFSDKIPWNKASWMAFLLLCLCFPGETASLITAPGANVTVLSLSVRLSLLKNLNELAASSGRLPPQSSGMVIMTLRPRRWSGPRSLSWKNVMSAGSTPPVRHRAEGPMADGTGSETLRGSLMGYLKKKNQRWGELKETWQVYPTAR